MHFCLALQREVCYNPSCSQGWYIGITAASQAVKAGSTPVPCSIGVADFVSCAATIFIVTAHSLRRSSSQNRTRCAGLRFCMSDGGNLSGNKRKARSGVSSFLESDPLYGGSEFRLWHSPLRVEWTRDSARAASAAETGFSGYLAVTAHSLRRSSSQNRTRCAGLRFCMSDGGNLSGNKRKARSGRSPQGSRLEADKTILKIETVVTKMVTTFHSVSGFWGSKSDARYNCGQGSSCANLMSEASLQTGI